MNNLVRLGTDYGGWECYLDILPRGCTILDLGIGEDTSFPAELVKLKDVKVVAVDPTEAARIHLMQYKDNPNWISYHQKAIAPHHVGHIFMHTNKLGGVSESIFSKHTAVNEFVPYSTECISITNLRELYEDISLLKMDIEGAEYGVYEEALGIPQILIEVHDFCIPDIPESRTSDMIDFFLINGYTCGRDKHNLTFIKC